MLRFEHNEFLYLLFLLVLIGLVFLAMVAWKKRAIRRIGDESLVKQLFKGYSSKRFRLKFWLSFLGFAFLALGAANLQMGDTLQKVTKKGVDVMIALDVSNSMLAQDLRPDRLTRAKQLINRLLDKIPEDRVGLVVFAGNAYQQMPLTVDFGAAKMYLNSINPKMIPTQGTAFDKAIEESLKGLDGNSPLHKAIVLVTDGEDWSDAGIQAAKKAFDKGVLVNTVGVGTTEGSPMKDPHTNDYIKDEKGDLVLSKLNEDILKSMAAAGHGIYQHLNQPDEAASILAQQLDTMQKKEFGENLFTDYKSYFQYFIGLGLLLLLIEFFLPETIREKKMEEEFTLA